MAFGDLFLNCCGRFRGAFEHHPLFNGADSLIHLALRDKRGGRPRCDRVLTRQMPDFGMEIWVLRQLVGDQIFLVLIGPQLVFRLKKPSLSHDWLCG